MLMLRASSQSCLASSVYLSPENEDVRRLAAEQYPLASGVHGFVVQQPMNSVALCWQM